tara:strand:- start:1056 stop:1583 length:528 start_codon:yes stop_codon:yes gene_type:complete
MDEYTTPQDGFSIYRRTQQRTQQKSNRSNKSRKDERVNLLNSVADGSLSADEALRRIGRTYSTGPIRFHHRISRDNRIEISGIVSNQTITLCVDEWQKLGAYLNGINFKGFVDRNEERLRTRRPPYHFKTTTLTEGTNATNATEVTNATNAIEATTITETTDTFSGNSTNQSDES